MLQKTNRRPAHLPTMTKEGADREERTAIAAAGRGRPIPATPAYHRFVEAHQGQLRLAIDPPSSEDGGRHE
jgi:hypothetical protein